MSLDITLKNDLRPRILEWEKRREASLKEAGEMKGLIPLIKEYYEDRKPTDTEDDYLFSTNITHNLGTMGTKAGIYDCVWRPDEMENIKNAGDIIAILKKGIEDMKARPDYYTQFDAKNGWGTYDQFIPWLEEYLNACIKYPEALIYVSR